jgi:TctA family transporter
VSERPIANSFSRWQVASGAESIAFLNQITIRPKVDIIRDLLSLLDGTKDHSQLVKEIKGRVTGIPKEQIEEFEKNTAEILKENLAAIANGGLLVR